MSHNEGYFPQKIWRSFPRNRNKHILLFNSSHCTKLCIFQMNISLIHLLCFDYFQQSNFFSNSAGQMSHKHTTTNAENVPYWFQMRKLFKLRRTVHINYKLCTQLWSCIQMLFLHKNEWLPLYDIYRKWKFCLSLIDCLMWFQLPILLSTFPTFVIVMRVSVS